MPDEDLSKLKIDKAASSVQRSKQKKPFFLAAALVLAVLAVVAFVSGIFSPAVEVEPALVSKVYPSLTMTLLNASGYVVPQRKAAVASKVTGRLISVHVEEGSIVKKGDIIAVLENEDALAAKQQAMANLAVAQADLEKAKAEQRDARLHRNRLSELLKEQLVPKADYDASEARYNIAAAAVEGAEARIKASTASLREAEVALGYTSLRAPFDAVVLTKNADVGDIVTPIGAAAEAKAAVVTIADMSSLQVEADVSESNISKVRLGQPCEIQLDALSDRRFRGEVHMIVPTADRTKASVMIKVRFIDKDTRILPEMSAKVSFLERQLEEKEMTPRTAVPSESVRKRNGKSFVFLIQDERIADTEIVAGESIGDMIEVISGVQPGDRIVSRPSEKLRDGMRIRIPEK